MSPRARRRGSAAVPVEWEDVLGKGGTGDEVKLGKEKLTTDEAGSKRLEVEAAPASQAAIDLLRTSSSGAAGAGVSVDVGARMDACSKCSLMTVAAGGMSCGAAATPLGGDVSVGCGLVCTGKADEVAAGA